jgi:hypothetical protein
LGDLKEKGMTSSAIIGDVLAGPAEKIIVE